MMRSLVIVVALTGLARADGGRNRVCSDSVDCEVKCKKNGDACLMAGVLSDKGEDAGDDGTKARGFYDKACKKKVARGCVLFGRNLQATGDAKLQKKAVTAFKTGVALFDKRCKKKDADACQELATIYASGMGAPQDQKKAEDYRQRSCQIRFNGPCPPPPPPPGVPQRPGIKSAERPEKKGAE